MFAEASKPPVESVRGAERAIRSTRFHSKRPEHHALNDNHEKKRRPPPMTEQNNPEPDLEEKLRENPEDADAKVDVGSDESMDASDPPSVVQPEHGEPVPSSGFEEEGDNGENSR